MYKIKQQPFCPLYYRSFHKSYQNFLILFITLFFSIQVINAQNAPVSTIGTVETYGTTTVVPITVTGFTEIGGCDLLINYDQTIATATSVSLGPGVGFYYFYPNITTPGIISVSWLFFQVGLQGLSLPDNSVLLNIAFDKVADGFSDIVFDNSLPNNCLFVDWNFDELNDTPNSTYYIDGAITFAPEEIVLSLKAFLEGPYNPATDKLNTDINGFIPLSHPFNPPLPYYGNIMPDWYYTGSSSVGSIPNVFVVDWVLLQLRDATSAATASSATAFATIPAFILNTGEIVDLDGLNLVTFVGSVVNDLFVVVWHRNHLGVISANPLIEVGGTYSYDFSSGESQVFGGASGHKELEPGVWGMVAADGDGNGLIQLSDTQVAWADDLGLSGYLGGDFNMNSLGQISDKQDVWLPNLGTGGQIPAKNVNTAYASQVPD